MTPAIPACMLARIDEAPVARQANAYLQAWCLTRGALITPRSFAGASALSWACRRWGVA